ncbi:hypothetical protein R1sor_006801 [Riccia sorocarpa]|uniref:DUF7869 domain-containing protein n=1 Tax=Riccia sorocarpa TaxID=122646 RepID=A0ABD3HNK9_9MARC
MYFKLRKNWSNVDVVLLSKIEAVPIAEGIIFLPFAKSCIEDEEVGEEYAGVLISGVLPETDPMLVARDLPHFVTEDPTTVRWPILRLKVVANGAILGHLYKAFLDSDLPQSQNDIGRNDDTRKKRSYNSLKRSKPDPLAAARKTENKRKEKRLSEASINACLSYVCSCKNECMRKVSKKDVCEEREFFYKEPYAKRIEYILTKFDHEGFAEGKMLFVHGQTICKPAFWTIYGFVKQTFYNYEGAYKMGERVGFHGNHGTLKPKDTTLFAKACMKTFFQQAAEPLPHKESRNPNTDGIVYRIPKIYSRDDVYEEIRSKMLAVNLAPISKIAFNDIWRKDFPNYGIHTSSAFAKCDDCLLFMNMLLRERRSAERAKWEHRREMHLKHQMSGRNEYYSHREMSTRTPSLYLSFIHDAMDHAKTYVPRLSDKLKSLMGHVTPLPLKVVGIINHGHEPNVVAHVTVTGIWKSDPNYTVSSIAKQLRDYETYFSGDCTGDLAFNITPVHPLFAALLDGDVFKTTVLEKKDLSREEYFGLQQQQDIDEGRRLKMLPPNLYIQLDNSAKDNKNWAVMAFCSELVARGCCKTITMSFLVVGHTHEDVDAFFSKVNAAQARRSIESLPHFLEVVHNAQSSKAYPRLIHEVADYKRHVADYVVKIEGQSAPVSFKFWMRDNIPIYQVKETYSGKWVPEHGRTLWKREDPESPTNFNVQLPPDQDPKLNEMIAPYAKKVEVSGFIRNYIKHKEELQAGTNPSTDVFAQDQCLIQYWKNVADVVQAGWTSNEESELQEAFWLITDYGTGHQVPSQTSTNPNSMGNKRREVEEELQARDEIFVGEAAARSLATFVRIIDITAGLMLLLRPSDDFECQDCLWVAKATGPVCRDESEPNFNKIPIQWWRPKHGSRKASIIDRYTQCIQRDVTWEIDPGYTGVHWIEADSCIYAWKSRAKGDKVSLPTKVQEIALAALEQIKVQSEQALVVVS